MKSNYLELGYIDFHDVLCEMVLYAGIQPPLL